jgi:hypothetical protein
MSFISDGHLLVFPTQKWGFLPKIKEIKRLCGGVGYYAAQASAPIDAEIGQKDHLDLKFCWYCIRVNLYEQSHCQLQSGA